MKLWINFCYIALLLMICGPLCFWLLGFIGDTKEGNGYVLLLEAMKHEYSKNRAVPVSDIFWVLVLLGYFCMCTPGVPKFFNKKKSFSFIFSFGYVTKIDKSSESGGNMNFRYNYMDIYFFYLLFWILICNLKTI